MMDKNKYKASTSSIISVAVVFLILTAVASNVIGTSVWGMRETINSVTHYYTLSADKQIQFLKQGFVKTAAFNAIQDTFGELITHGNVPESYLTDTEDPTGYADGIYPCMKVKETDEGDLIPYWAYPGNDEMLKKIPYIVVKDPHITYGSAENYITTNENDQITQYVDDVIDGEYDLHLLIHVFMLKRGSFEITGGPGITMTPATGNPAIINYDGTYEYIITDIDPDNLVSHHDTPITLQFDARNETGEIDRVAYVDYMAVTAFDCVDSSFVDAQNRLFVENLEKYQLALEDELEDRNDDDENIIKIEVSPLDGIYIPTTNLRAVVWSEADGIKAYMDDPFFLESNEKLLDIQSSGLVEEETKLRQKLLTDAGTYLIDNMEILNNSIFEAMNEELEDYNSSTDITDECKDVGSSDIRAICPDDTTKQYTHGNFVAVIQAGLDKAASELNSQFAGEGLEFELIGPDLIRIGCYGGQTNNNRDADSEPDVCISETDSDINDDFGAYLIYIEHRKSSCTAHLCDKDEHTCNGHVDGVEKYYNIKCHRTYAHQYILKNIRVLVRIKDTATQYFNANSNPKGWEEPILQFYVTIGMVDDNDCDGHVCSSIITEDASCPTHDGTHYNEGGNDD